MLADFEMAMMMFFLIIAVVFGGTEMVAMVSTEFSVQSEAQVVAMSEGHYGGYTDFEKSSVELYIDNYCQNNGLDSAQATVGVSAAGAPVPYGTDVTSVITIPFKFMQIRNFMPGALIYLTGKGRSVSSYIQGMTPDVAYVSP
jgi:hypothetical protein